MDAPAAPRPVGLVAALLAAAIAVGWLFHYSHSALQLAEKYVRAVGPANDKFKAQTLTIQRAALQLGDVLPIYGTSELYCCAGSFNAGYFFEDDPTGFSVLSVGYPLTADLFWAETFGALGNALRGHKLVVSDSAWFIVPSGLDGGVTTSEYGNSYQPDIAAIFTFDAPIPLALRAAVARRMVDFPSTFETQSQQVEQAGLLDLSRGGIRGYGAYLLLQPLGRLVAWQDKLNDAKTTITLLRGTTFPLTNHPRLARILSALDLIRTPTLLSLPTAQQPSGLTSHYPVKPQQINWNLDLAEATQQAEAQSKNNPFGVAGTGSFQRCSDILPVSGSECAQALQLLAEGHNNHSATYIPIPKNYLQGVEQCPCWTDLNLEFETLDAIGAKPLAWLQPLEGYMEDYTEYSAATRRAIYDRYMALAKADGITATDFETHDDDPYFTDSFGHLSQRGWVYADRLINLFWHGQLSLVSAEMAKGGSTDLLFSPALNCPVQSWCQGVDNVAPLPGELDDLPEGMPSLWNGK